MFNIVLLEPEIPANTGNIGRTCLVTGARLHLIEPMGFILNDKNLKRAGLDYWDELKWLIHDSFNDFKERYKGRVSFNEQEALEIAAGKSKTDDGKIGRMWYATTKATKTYAEADFKDGDYIMFGKESAGIPEELLVEAPERCIRIPMIQDQRSLNLSNAVSIVLYEALRQNGFPGLQNAGELHRLNW